MTIVLDAWAVTALFGDEHAADRVERALDEDHVVVSWINLGESFYNAIKRRGRPAADAALRSLLPLIEAEAPDPELVLAAATVKAHRRLSYADAFCVATGQRHRAPVWTGDPEILALDDVVEVVDLR
ncbi:MAG: type II toxin-antitoxin system VapC family toxin [Solirubrobacterales bacterium]|nr:type II toxin-antitoxin system VapC family toxin [Solirubrobacterales bacterium]MBA3860422.1 type II toxin-antitoxin system VapC family toxin [Solirubrobacterales bacterium]